MNFTDVNILGWLWFRVSFRLLFFFRWRLILLLLGFLGFCTIHQIKNQVIIILRIQLNGKTATHPRILDLDLKQYSLRGSFIFPHRSQLIAPEKITSWHWSLQAGLIQNDHIPSNGIYHQVTLLGVVALQQPNRMHLTKFPRKNRIDLKVLSKHRHWHIYFTCLQLALFLNELRQRFNDLHYCMLCWPLLRTQHLIHIIPERPKLKPDHTLHRWQELHRSWSICLEGLPGNYSERLFLLLVWYLDLLRYF